MGLFSKPMTEDRAFQICSMLQHTVGAELHAKLNWGVRPAQAFDEVWAKVWTQQMGNRQNWRDVNTAVELINDRYPKLLDSMLRRMVEHMENGGTSGHLRMSLEDEKGYWQEGRAKAAKPAPTAEPTVEDAFTVYARFTHLIGAFLAGVVDGQLEEIRAAFEFAATETLTKITRDSPRDGAKIDETGRFLDTAMPGMTELLHKELVLHLEAGDDWQTFKPTYSDMRRKLLSPA